MWHLAQVVLVGEENAESKYLLPWFYTSQHACAQRQLLLSRFSSAQESKVEQDNWK